MTADRISFIAAMRRVANSVTVVTTDGPLGRHGATVSAFSSVSADPPAVLVCLRAASRIASLVTGNGQFCINVLDQDDHAVAEIFAGRSVVAEADRFAGIPLAAGGHPHGPVLATSVCAFSCRLANIAAFGSHLVVVGGVEAVCSREAMPLAYVNGAYAEVITRQFLN
ncbi:MAG TPA: flavin reductase family protein [Alphaproteobacteria bacterium]|nr:flavin reductase family protein [Alphaproteobacteria bacterium]